MKVSRKVLALLFFTIVLGVGQLWSTEASAQSSYFTSRGCVDCHASPVTATCNGCHQHGNSSLRATANKTSYSPGETVTVTLTGGSRTGWIGARLYDQTGAEIARPTGNQSGMGSSTTFPAVLSAPAPMTAGTYTWKMAYFGNLNGTGSGDVHGEQAVNVTFTVASAADTTAPVVGTFTLPATATSLTVPVSALTASDNVAVTGYLINKSATAPAASATGWTGTAPTSVTAVAGSNTFYAWAKDAAGNVSAARSATVVVTLPDATAPVVGTFTLPATATSLTVPVSALTASDNVAVTGYLINKSATAPAASATGWTATAPTSVTAVAGSNTFYAWARDAAGNVSAARSATVVVTLPDATAPVVATFTLPATATSLTVPVSALTASDNVAVTGYLINKSATAPAASATGWTATAPTSVTAIAGSNTFYAWAKDAAGNVSAARSATVVVTLADTTAPVVGTFTLPATATSLTVPVSAFTATDNVAVTGYLINKSATAPAASATGWVATAPASVTAVAGSNTFYAWARDAAGNVSVARSATVVVTLADTTAPVVGTFTLPATATSLTVPVSAFTATDNVAVTGYMITTSATTPAASAVDWSTAAPAVATAPAAGSNTFYAWARDAAGNVSAARSATVTITISTADTTPPTLTVSTLANGSLTNKVTLNVSGTASDAGALQSVTVNGQDVAVNADGSFSAALNLVAGANVITVVAIDQAGNQTTSSRTITYDSAAPVLTISAPADNSTSVQSFVTVSGTVNENSAVTVKVNDGSAQSAALTGTGFAATVNLVTGINTIDITATDLAGNVTSAKRTVTYSAPASQLTLAVTNPAQDVTTRRSTMTIRGTVADGSGAVKVTVNVNGRTYYPAVSSTGTFSKYITFYSGSTRTYVITVTAKDASGNTATVTRNVIYRPYDGDHDDEHDDD